MQIFIIGLVCRLVIQLIDGVALRTGDQQLTSEGLPAGDVGGVYMQILAAQHHEHRRVVGAFALVGEYIGLIFVEVGSEGSAAEDLHILLDAAQVVAQRGHRHTPDGYEHFNGLDPAVPVHELFEAVHHAFFALGVHVHLYHLHTGVGVFVDSGGYADGCGGYSAVEDVAVG